MAAASSSASASASAIPSRLSDVGAGATHTPVKRPTFVDTPGRSRPSGASPAYSSRKHSLYGIEDRVVLDLGSRVWKVGFSGETEPRAVFWAQGDRGFPDVLEGGGGRGEGGEMWDLDIGSLRGVRGDRNEGRRLVRSRMVKRLRDVFHKYLISDPKLRKVIVIENTYLPTVVKEAIALALFQNLRTPSVAFTSSSLLSLAACGRISGLVVDCGWLETTITPVYYSRPLYHLSSSIPLAGRALHRRLRALMHHHASYHPPPKSMSSVSHHPAIKPPRSILTDELIERIITEACFVGPPTSASASASASSSSSSNQNQMDVDPRSDAEPKDRLTVPPKEEIDDVLLMDTLRSRYGEGSTATDLRFSVDPDSETIGEWSRNASTSSGGGMGPGVLVVPGWIRERAAEVIFEDDEVGESPGLPGAILQCLLKLPIDLRSLLISTMLVVGGTASLPGFIPRLRTSLLEALNSSKPTDTARVPDSAGSAGATPTSAVSSHASPEDRRAQNEQWRHMGEDRYKPLRSLASKLAILNDPTPWDGEGGTKNASVAPRWTPGLMTWVGGSLAGTLKTSGPAMLLEDYEALISSSSSRGDAYRQMLEESEAEVVATVGIDIDELRPGEARRAGRREGDGGSGNEYLGRKRGWRDSVVTDWSRRVEV